MLDVNQIKPLEITYESIVEDAKMQVCRVLNFIEVLPLPHQVMDINSQIQKMPCDISQEIIRQYKSSNLFTD